MRILIYGAGVIGSIFAGKLAAAGHDVVALARGRRLNTLLAEGLKIRDIRGMKTVCLAPSLIERLNAGDIYDYIIVTMQYSQIDAVLPVLKENSSHNIVLCVNNPGGYANWTEYLGDRLMIGFPACGGEIVTSDTGAVTEYYVSRGLTRLFQTTTFGEPDGTRTKRLVTLVRLFRDCGIPSVISGRIDNWQKCHLSVVLPIAEAILKNGGDIKTLASNRQDIKMMLRATREGFDALKELGFSVEPRKLNFYYMPLPFLCFVFSLVFRTTLTEFSMAKHTNNAKSEMLELQRAFEALIRNTRTGMPNIEALSKAAWPDDDSSMYRFGL
jgi:2-dehydropantoate 2-reductase